MKGNQLREFEFLHFQFAIEHETSSKNTMETYETRGEGKSCFEFVISATSSTRKLVFYPAISSLIDTLMTTHDINNSYLYHNSFQIKFSSLNEAFRGHEYERLLTL